MLLAIDCVMEPATDLSMLTRAVWIIKSLMVSISEYRLSRGDTSEFRICVYRFKDDIKGRSLELDMAESFEVNFLCDLNVVA